MIEPDIGFYVGAALPVLALGWVYRGGAIRRADIVLQIPAWRHVAFAAGLGLFFLSVEWPFARWAHELFFVHQIGIMIARIVSPMLIAVARPAGLLIAGTPRPVREALLRPALSDRRVQEAWRVIGSAPVALLLYVAALYVWEIPATQTDALINPVTGLTMHLSLWLAGLLFWSRIFARRPAPHGVAYGARLMMVWIAMLTQLPLGAYITVKRAILYPAYALGEHFAGISPLADEAGGGFFIWVPSAFLTLAALIFVVDMLGRHETRLDEKRRRWSPSNSAILLYPETARALRAMTRVKNRRMGIGMFGFGVAVFVAIWSMTVSGHRLNRRQNLQLYELSRR